VKNQKVIIKILALSLLGLAACQRANKEDASSISSVSIAFPTVQQFAASQSKTMSQSVGALAVVDYSKMCLSVQASGAGIVPTEGLASCDWRKGVVSAVAIPGQTIELEVPKGTNRTFDVYGYLRDNTTDACPTVPAVMTSAVLAKTYLLGRTIGVELSQAQATVNIQLSLPQDTNTVVSQLSLPACSSGTVDPGSSGGALTSTSFKIYDSGVVGHTSLVGTTASFKIKGQVVGKDQVAPATSTNFKLTH
jgi:hypothetical protein